jgi:hypothetical protein
MKTKPLGQQIENRIHMNVSTHVIEWAFQEWQVQPALRSEVGLNGENAPPKTKNSHPTLLNFHSWELFQLLRCVNL